MQIPTITAEREKLLKLAEEYRSQGYEVLLDPNREDLPDFLQKYRPDLILYRGDESVVIQVKSRSQLNSSSTQYLRNLARTVEQHPGWRFELVMTNSANNLYPPGAKESLQAEEIAAKLQSAKQLVMQNLESAILYAWSLAEATLRLLAEKEGVSLQRFDPFYVVKHLVTEGVISRAEYQRLMDALTHRNAISHGFKTTQLTEESVNELIETTAQLLKALDRSEELA